MNSVIKCFMNGQGLSLEEAQEQYKELLREMSEANEQGTVCEMEELMYQYGLELDYVEQIVHDMMMGVR